MYKSVAPKFPLPANDNPISYKKPRAIVEKPF